MRLISRRLQRSDYLTQVRTYCSHSDSGHKFQFTHLSSKSEVKMVDVSHKEKTMREATARAIVWLGTELVSRIHQLPKGDVLSTAKIAGIQGCKSTSSLIPLCHQIALTEANIEIRLNPESGEVVIDCRVRTNHETGVEMEALTGAAIASLTIYDMCKAVNRSIVIRDIRLLAKSGGRCDYRDDEAAD